MMSFSQRQINILVSLYIGLILNAVILFRHASKSGIEDFFIAACSAIAVITLTYGIAAFFSLFGKTAYKILVGFLILASSAASYYMIFFNVVIGYGIILSTLTWDTDLSKESVGWYFLIWVLITGMIPAGILAFSRINQHLYDWRWHSLKRFIFSFRFCVAGFLLFSISLKAAIYLIEQQETKNNQYFGSPGGNIAHSYLPSNWIAGFGLFLYQQLEEKNASKKLFDPGQHFTYQTLSHMDDLVLVFVIGETTRWDHMGILGYSRDTSPLLAREKNLVALRGESCDTATKLSMRCMFVREGGTENNKQHTLKERNVFSVLRKLGFTSELFAMQSETWFYSSTDTQKYEIREVIAAAYNQKNKPVNDMILVDQLITSLSQHPKGKHLVILHTKGSHFSYSQRHTPEFSIFKPECISIDDGCTREQLINSFDNSVLFVDYTLKNIIDQLRNKNALMFYVSDHGESIDENSHFHATPKEMAPPEQFRVPVIVWASDKFLAVEQNLVAFQQLKNKQASAKVVKHTEIYDSVLGCMGFTSPDGGINQQNNWCN
jgi:KDO II ethanolaminephosphotransferase